MDNINFDPNIRFAKQTVLLTFAEWDFRKSVEVVVERSNCRGQSIIDFAIDTFYDQLCEAAENEDELLSIKLTNPAGEILVTEDDENHQEEWLRNLLIKAEIIAFEEVI